MIKRDNRPRDDERGEDVILGLKNSQVGHRRWNQMLKGKGIGRVQYGAPWVPNLRTLAWDLRKCFVGNEGDRDVSNGMRGTREDAFRLRRESRRVLLLGWGQVQQKESTGKSSETVRTSESYSTEKKDTGGCKKSECP